MVDAPGPTAHRHLTAALLAKAKRPLILAGGGIHLSEAWDSLTNFAESLNVPVAHTMSGKGSISCASELNAGLFGRYSRIANDLIESSDCLLAVGCKLGEIATKRYDLLPGNVPLISWWSCKAATRTGRADALSGRASSLPGQEMGRSAVLVTRRVTARV